MEEDRVYRLAGTDGPKGGQARQNAEPGPPYTTGRGARVARQRSPILRTGVEKILARTAQNKRFLRAGQTDQ